MIGPIVFIADDPSVVDGDDTPSERIDDCFIVGCEDDSRTVGINLEKEVDDALGRERVEVSGWFVRQDHCWVVS